MAARFDAAADRLLRTTDLLDYNAVYTWMAWIYLVSDLNAAGRLWSLNVDAVGNDFDFVGVNTDGTTLVARTAVGASTTTGTGTNLSITTWYHVALVRSATNTLDVYLNGVLDSTHTRATAGRTAVTRMEAGAWTSSNASRTDSRMAAMKAYNTNLTAAEIAAEMNTYRPIRTANLYAWWPIFNGDRTTDYNGNVRPWTEGGTLTDEAPPPISYGAPVYFIPWTATTINGVGAYTQADDTVVATGTADIVGVSNYTQANDTAGGAGTGDIAGVSSYTQANDTVVGTATADIAGVSNYTQANDTAGGAGTADITGQSAYTQANDSVLATGTVAIVGTVSYTQADDTAGGAGTGDIAAVGAFTQANDTVVAAGIGDIAGTASITQSGDTVVAAGTVTIVGAGAYTQDDDTLVAFEYAPVTVTIVETGSDVLKAEGRAFLQTADVRLSIEETDNRYLIHQAENRAALQTADVRVQVLRN